MLSANDVVDLTGCSYRMLDYWIRAGVVPVIGSTTPGSGHSRSFDESCVDKIKLLSTISKTFNSRLEMETLKKIYNNYEDGCVYLDNGITLSWELDNKLEEE